MPRVLIAEDDRVIADAMASHLRHAGMEVEWADRGDRAIRKIRFERPDVAVIDLMLPGMDGWRIIETLRADDVDDPGDRGLARAPRSRTRCTRSGSGGDDYLAKPFGMAELVARVQAAAAPGRTAARRAARRAGRGAGPGDRPRPAPGVPRRRGTPAHPHRVPAAAVLASERGRVMTRDQLQQRVWGMPHRPRDRSVDVCVRKLREKLDHRSPTHDYIHTHYGVGYRFDAVPLER